jgi:hypothetical protein
MISIKSYTYGISGLGVYKRLNSGIGRLDSSFHWNDGGMLLTLANNGKVTENFGVIPAKAGIQAAFQSLTEMTMCASDD